MFADTESLHWPITRACCDMTWQATTEDSGSRRACSFVPGLPAPNVLAIVDLTSRTFPRTRTIATAAQLREFVAFQAPNELPIFCLPNRGIASFGEISRATSIRRPGRSGLHGPRIHPARPITSTIR